MRGFHLLPLPSGTQAPSVLLIHHLSILILTISRSLLFKASPPPHGDVAGVGEKHLLRRLCLFVWKTKLPSADFPLYLTSQDRIACHPSTNQRPSKMRLLWLVLLIMIYLLGLGKGLNLWVSRYINWTSFSASGVVRKGDECCLTTNTAGHTLLLWSFVAPHCLKLIWPVGRHSSKKWGYR